MAVIAARPPEPGGIRVLYPANRTVHKGIVRLIVAAPLAARLTAEMDRKPLHLQRLVFADSWQLAGRLKATAELVGDRSRTALWAAEFPIPAGAHEVTVGGQRLQLRGDQGPVPSGWTASYTHPAVKPDSGPLDCAACHELSGSAIGAVSTPSACASCHDEPTIQLIHRHVAEPLARCAMCHDPHGSTRPKLLTDEKVKLCSKCHEPGHFKG
jgi:predicted CXXCH cytochrome family protein